MPTLWIIIVTGAEYTVHRYRSVFDCLLKAIPNSRLAIFDVA